MVVGHNPNFSEFLGHLVAENGSRAYIEMKKGAVAKVESAQKKFVLQWLLTPRLANATSEASVVQSSGNELNSQNGVGHLELAAKPLEKPKSGKKQPQAALTTNSRPKTSRK
jgi:hypothetical protein